jgi:beta-RFAP synthase
MTRLRVRTPSRLHFGLLGWGPAASRQFGGLGLMIEEPDLEVVFRSAAEWCCEGPLAGRVRDLVRSLESCSPALGPALVRIERTPPEHAGLGVGTQLSLAIVRGLLELAEFPTPSIEQMAALSGRGRRSGVGLHGFVHGGLIVDGGHAQAPGVPPLVARSVFPEDWGILLVQPPGPRGRHGPEEAHSFARIPPMPERVTERLCRLVLLGILPALAERNLRDFGEALSEFQRRVGEEFATLQGGPFSSPMAEAIVMELGRLGLVGAGQSSWGPTLYGFSESARPRRDRISALLTEAFPIDPSGVRWTRAANHGAVVERLIE